MHKTIYREETSVFLEILLEARARSGLTQAAVADLLGRPQSTMSHIERGGRRLDVIEFIDYCRALRADPVELLEELLRRLDKPGRRSPRRRPNTSR